MMEEFSEEYAVLEARRLAAVEKLQKTTDASETKRLQDELSQIDAAFTALGEEDA
jgi:hypothetical protein